MTVETAKSAHPRDYSLEGPLNARAVQIGLANAEWYKTDIPRARMKQLMQRSDGPATRDTILWIGGLIVTGGLGAYFWGTWWCVPFFIIYGVLYGSGGDSRWHECGHGTAFKTQWKNDVVYQIACFMRCAIPTVWRWSHTRHHTDTIIVGRDPEIIIMRPPDVAKAVLNFFGMLDVPQSPGGHAALCRGQAHAGREGLHPRKRARQGLPCRPRLDGDLSRRDRRLFLSGFDPAGDAHWPAPHVWRLASCC